MTWARERTVRDPLTKRRTIIQGVERRNIEEHKTGELDVIQTQKREIGNSILNKTT